MKKIVTIIVLLILSSFIFIGIVAAKDFYYKDMTGANIKEFSYRMERKAQEIIIKVIDEKVDYIPETYICNYDLSTKVYQKNAPKEDTDFRIIRKDNELIITGWFKGEYIDKSIRIDNDLWRQNFNFSLSDFIKSDKEKTTFWIVNPDNLKVHKMLATKQEIEKIKINGQRIKTQHVRLRFAGFLSIFWKADCWYKASDGTYLKYKGTQGPGTSETVIELLSVKN